VTAEYICECGHPKSQHKRQREGCRSVECAGACAKFEADMAASAAAQGTELATGGIVTGPVRLPSSGCVIDRDEEVVPFTVPVAELGLSSARLAEVEQERSELAAKLDAVSGHLDLRDGELVSANAQRDQANDLTDKIAAELRGVTKERDSLARRCAVRFEEAEKLRAELVSARQEIEQLRNRLDQCAEAGGRDIADGPDVDLPTRIAELRRGRKEATERALELAALVARVEQAAGIDPERDRGVDLADRIRSIRDGRAEAIDAFVTVLSRQDRYLCETCGARYGQPFTDHEHGPLTPVTVTIARQGAPTA
jgi:chromosome segregation ATPase